MQRELPVQGRRVPLIVVASARPGIADEVAQRLRGEGHVVYATHSAQGCLRVATSVGPDIVLLDGKLPRLEQLLRAHPRCARTRILHLGDPDVRTTLPAPPAPHVAAA